MGHRHPFEQNICGTETSRSRPEDLKANYRFIFGLVHPTREPPSDVLRDAQTPHPGTASRQGRRKKIREELIRQSHEELIEKMAEHRKEDGAKTEETVGLECDRDSAAQLQMKTILDLKAKLRRVTTILGDALRTGEIRDEQSHRSILIRALEDAPEAFNLLPDPLPAPPWVIPNSQQSSMLQSRDGLSVAENSQVSQDAWPQDPNNITSLEMAHINHMERPGMVPDSRCGDQDADTSWVDFVNFP